MQHAFEKIWPVLIVEVLTAAIIVWRILSAQRGKELFIRRIPGLNAIDEAIGRATEMGRPVLMVPGIGGFGVVALQALSIFSYIARSTAKFGNRIIMPVADATVYTVAEEVIRDAYQAEGHPERFDPDSIRFLSDRQFAFASGVAGLIQREQIASSFMFGEFFAESLIFAETGNMVGAIQVAGTVQTTQIPFFIAACDYTIIGDEYYAASAYISRDPTMLGSLVGQDFGKLLITALFTVGMISATLAALDVPALSAAGKWFIELFQIR
ncbi:MAG: hypothetical protein RMM08_12675 [Armatimonadota bacterium]|nr:hypothetical protein [Armatimonadota bacterium]